MKRIIFATAALVLVLAMLGVGTLAYFTSTRTSYTNSFTTGTLDLQLSDANEDWAPQVYGTWTSPANWAPGEVFVSTLGLRNAGNVDALMVYADWNNLQGNEGLANWIEVVEISDSYPWIGGSNLPYGDNYVVNFQSPAASDANGDGHLTLAELIVWGTNKTTSGSPHPWDVSLSSVEIKGPPAILPAGATLGIRFGFKLMAETPNEFQGATCTVDLAVMASQSVLPSLP